jgi:hypothetical protein
MSNLRTHFLSASLVSASLAGAIALAAVGPCRAAPVMTSSAELKALAPVATQVRWRGGGRIAGGIIGGLAAGAILGAATAPYYYGGGPYYGYDAGPVYVDPGPAYPQTYYYNYGRDPASCGPGYHVC